MIDKDFGEALRQIRREAGLTQRELASKTGLDFSYISKVENGRNPPPAADTIVQLCAAMGVQPEALLALTGKLPSDVQKAVGANSAAQEFLRFAQKLNLSDDEWRRLSQQARRLRPVNTPRKRMPEE
jgi:transcriptional regulator with XRE-family HTH domain